MSRDDDDAPTLSDLFDGIQEEAMRHPPEGEKHLDALEDVAIELRKRICRRQNMGLNATALGYVEKAIELMQVEWYLDAKYEFPDE